MINCILLGIRNEPGLEMNYSNILWPLILTNTTLYLLLILIGMNQGYENANIVSECQDYLPMF